SDRLISEGPRISSWTDEYEPTARFMRTTRSSDRARGAFGDSCSFMLLSILVVLAAASPSPEKTIALSSVTGPSRSAPAELERALEKELEKRGYSVVGESALKRAERRLGKKSTRAQAAKSAGAELLASVEVNRDGQRFVASAELV